MKKLFLFLSLATLTVGLNSCSKDDDSSDSNNNNNPTPSSITVKINGVTKTFNTVVVDQDTYTEGTETFTELTVSASINNSTNEIITFTLDKGDVGTNAIYAFDYRKDGKTFNTYNSESQSFNSITQTNSNNKITGTFGGGLSYWNNDTQAYETVTTSEGNFSISY